MSADPSEWPLVFYFEAISHGTDNATAEVRVHTRIPARHIWHAATRPPDTDGPA